MNNRPNYNAVDEIFKSLKLDNDPILAKIKGQPSEYVDTYSLEADRLARYELLQLWDVSNNPKGWSKNLPYWKIEHQRLLDNQEKHKEEDLKPSDLPADWKAQLAQLKKFTDKFGDTNPEDIKELPSWLPDDYENIFKPLEAGKTKREPKELKPDDYDTIKAERDGWISKFPKPLTPDQVKQIYDAPKGIQLTDKQKEAIDNYSSVLERLNKWEGKFPRMTPDQVNQGTSSTETDDLKRQIQRLETLLRGRNSRNINNVNERKRETKICEICNQIKNDIFKYSRISARGFDLHHLYRICSFCQKIVRIVV